MLNKKTRLLILICVCFLAFGFISTVKAELRFKPNVEIPGMSAVFDKAHDFDVATNRVYLIPDDGTGVAKYIVTLYSYSAVFVGIVAMFMLVLAGWQWLMAGGDSGKINQAKDNINAVLIGLALLFGGYILLRQIGRNLTNFGSLNVPPPPDLVDNVGTSGNCLTASDCAENYLCLSPVHNPDFTCPEEYVGVSFVKCENKTNDRELCLCSPEDSLYLLTCMYQSNLEVIKCTKDSDCLPGESCGGGYCLKDSIIGVTGAKE